MYPLLIIRGIWSSKPHSRCFCIENLPLLQQEAGAQWRREQNTDCRTNLNHIDFAFPSLRRFPAGVTLPESPSSRAPPAPFCGLHLCSPSSSFIGLVLHNCLYLLVLHQQTHMRTNFVVYHDPKSKLFKGDRDDTSCFRCQAHMVRCIRSVKSLDTGGQVPGQEWSGRSHAQFNRPWLPSAPRPFVSTPIKWTPFLSSLFYSQSHSLRWLQLQSIMLKTPNFAVQPDPHPENQTRISRCLLVISIWISHNNTYRG